MRICFTLSSLCSGGAERVAASLCNYFVSQGIDVTIILVSINYNNSFYELNDKINVIPLIKRKKDKIPFFRVKLLRRAILDAKPDIVISFLPHINIYTWLALHKTSIPHICSERNDPKQYGLLYQFLLKIVFKNASGCVFQTSEALKFYKGVKSNNAAIIKNPVFLTFKPKTYYPKIEKTFISVGRLSKQKNFQYLINTFFLFNKQIKGYTLIIYGEGPLRQKLEKLIKKLGLENSVLLPGTNNNWHEIVFHSTCFVLSSNYEGIPNCLEEALCLGCPAIATDCPVGGSKELVEMFETGVLITPNNTDELFQAMKNIALNDSGMRKPPSNNNLDVHNIGQQWIDFIAGVIKRN